MIRGFVYSITKARSLIREQATPRGAVDDSGGGRAFNPDGTYLINDDSLADIEDTARRYDPWLFSEACEQMLESLASLSDPTPVDVMNWTMLLTAPPKRFKDDPDGPGDSIGMRLILPSYCPIRWEHPHRLLDALDGFSLWGLPDR